MNKEEQEDYRNWLIQKDAEKFYSDTKYLLERLDIAETHVAELQELIAELLEEYKTARLKNINEYVHPSYYDRVIANLDEKITTYRKRATFDEQRAK